MKSLRYSKYFRYISTVIGLSLAIMLLAGCRDDVVGTGSVGDAGETTSGPPTGQGTRDNTPLVLIPEAPGAVVFEATGVLIDASNVSEGYVMVNYSGASDKVRLLIDAPSGARYQYRLDRRGEFETFPLSEGSGTYTVGVYENITGDKYATVLSQEIGVEMPDPNRTFLYPNQFVDFKPESLAVGKAQELATAANNDLDVVYLVYYYIEKNIQYDYDLAETVESGYLPVIDNTLQTNKGICFDYASLTAAMLRSQRIPTKLEIGYAGTVYHAWISVYIEGQGWIDGAIYFDGEDYQLMDPTMASYTSHDEMRRHMEGADNYYDTKYYY